MVAHFVETSDTDGSGVLHDGLNINIVAQAWYNVLIFLGIKTPIFTPQGPLMYEHFRSWQS